MFYCSIDFPCFEIIFVLSMPPRKIRHTIEPKPSMGLTPLGFSNENVEKYFNELQGKTFVQ